MDAGFIQRLCAKGHYTTQRFGYETGTCDVCLSPIAWRNEVIQTEFHDAGFIHMIEYLNRAEVFETCHSCGHRKRTHEATYRIPTQGETQRSRTAFDDNGRLVWLHPSLRGDDKRTPAEMVRMWNAAALKGEG